MSHAVARLRAQRLAASSKPFVTRGSGSARCETCRLKLSHCVCALRPAPTVRAGVCLIMADIEPLKPSNTGWLIADLVPDTWAFGWSRVAVDPALTTLLADPQWQPYVVFPGEYVAPERVVTALPAAAQHTGKRPLFVLLDGTWSEARKMFRRSPYLDHLPVLSLQPGHDSTYRLRRSAHAQHFCTAEVAAQCLALAHEPLAADTLAAYFDVFSAHYLSAKRNLRLALDTEAHTRLAALTAQALAPAGVLA